MKTYTIDWADGMTTTHDTIESALQAIESRYPTAEIGHDGDLDGGGARTLCWSDAESSRDDDGRHAIAAIRHEGGAR